MQLIQRIKKRLFRPRVLSGLVTSGSRAPRSRDAFVEQGQSQVYRIVSEGDVQELFQKINALWDNAWGNLFQPEHRILIKINLNTDHLLQPAPMLANWLTCCVQRFAPD